MKKIVLIATSILLLTSCSKETSPVDTDPTGHHDIMVSVNTQAISAANDEDSENKLELLTALSFIQMPGSDRYLYETRFTQPVDAQGQIDEMAIRIIGPFPRIFYFFANSMDNITDFTGDMRNYTSTMLEADAYQTGNAPIPTAPFCLVAKLECPDPSIVKTISANLAHTVARIDIDNRYPSFTIDSMVLNDAPSGSYLFNNNAAKSTIKSVNYGNPAYIYMYPTTQSSLSFYGKYNGIRTGFDVELNTIKSGTRYRLTLRDEGDASLSSNDISWDVIDWNTGGTINTTPGQK